MFRNESGVIRHRNTFQNENLLSSSGRFVPLFPTRRPLQYPGRRVLGNRFPHQVFRPFTRGPSRPGRTGIEPPKMNANYPGSQNYSRPFIPPPYTERCPIPRNISGHFPRNEFPPIPYRMTGDLEKKNTRCGLLDSPTLNYQEELWIETMSPNGKLYYYNANSRATTWDKPENVKIVNILNLKALANSQHNGQAQDIRMQNRENICASQNVYLEPVPPMQNLNTLPQRLVMFPPPNLSTPPPFFVPSSSTRYHIPPSPFNQINPPGITTIPEVNATATLNEDTSATYCVINTKNPADIDNQSSNTVQINQNNCSGQEQKVLSSEMHFSVNESNEDDTKNYFTTEQSRWEVTSEDPVFMEEGNTDNISHNVESFENSKNEIEGEVMVAEINEDKLKRSNLAALSNTASEDVTQIDKSRPVSSTPIAGSKWCVVWTGDDKVFYYDAYRKISVWDTPEELKHRSDVKKLIESPPVILEKIQESVPSGSDAKKIKIEVENTPTVIETGVQDEVEKPTIQEIVLKATKQREDIPRETRVQMFMQMLAERKVSPFSTWEKELHKIVFDSRYLLLSHRERRQKFEVYVNAKIEEEKKLRKREILTMRDNFTQLLEEAGVSHNTWFSDFAHKYAKDSRFQAIERTKEKEKLFNNFVHNLRRMVSQSSTSERQTSKFIELLKEQTHLRADSIWSELKKKISGDDRYVAVSCEENRRKMFRDFIRSTFPDASSNSKGKEDRINASIQTRRKEVKQDMSMCMRELEEERLMYKRDSLNNAFTALLVDLVRNPDIKFRDAIRSLKEDHRWVGVSDLRQNERERLFDAHIRQLKSRKKDQFHRILDEVFKDIDLTSTWKDVRKTIRGDPRCVNFFSDEKKCEREFDDYMKERLRTAKEDYRKLLKETKIITHLSKDLLKNTSHLENIENALGKDKRYLVLKCIENERKKLLMSYIDSLNIKGPPPPPTASDPSRR